MKIKAIYDNQGKTADRYTVVYDEKFNSTPGLYNCLSMNEHPFHPQGIGQHSSAMLGRHLGKRITFGQLPTDCQKAVKQDLTPYREQVKNDMLTFLTRHPGLSSIASDSKTRRAALSLENDGFIHIIKHENAQWQVKKIMKIITKIKKDKYGYRVSQSIDGRTFKDCQTFSTRKEAEEAIPYLNDDLKISIETGII